MDKKLTTLTVMVGLLFGSQSFAEYKQTYAPPQTYANYPQENAQPVNNQQNYQVNVNEVRQTSDSGESSNEEILNQVRAIIRNADRHYNLKIRISGGVVTLTGYVNNEQDKKNIEDAVRKINGVKDVDNKLSTRQK